MNKIFKALSLGSTLAVAVILASCGDNTAKNKELKDADDAKVQQRVDEKLNALNVDVNNECNAYLDSAVTARYTEWFEKEGKKKGAKPAPKPAPKKEEAKKEETPKTGIGSKQGTEENKGEIGTGKMGTAKDTARIGKGKQGVQPK